MELPKTGVYTRLRAQSLDQMRILDTPVDERFDRLSRLAKKLFDVPIALVSLVNSGGQWFEYNRGSSIALTSKDIPFFHRPVLQKEVLIVSDVSLHPNFSANPLPSGH